MNLENPETNNMIPYLIIAGYLLIGFCFLTGYYLWGSNCERRHAEDMEPSKFIMFMLWPMVAAMLIGIGFVWLVNKGASRLAKKLRGEP